MDPDSECNPDTEDNLRRLGSWDGSDMEGVDHTENSGKKRSKYEIHIRESVSFQETLEQRWIYLLYLHHNHYHH